jgi:thymidylate synthase
MDRTGVGTRSVFGRQIRCRLEDGFPALTTKKLFWKPVVGELLWFLRGSRDNKVLADITYGDLDRRTIWSPNANDPGKEGSPNAWLTNPHRICDDDVGRIYGVQWRKWRHTEIVSYDDYLDHDPTGTTYFGAKAKVTEIDQIASIINKIKTNPADRRMVLTAFNVGEMDQMSLPPCHMFAQFHVSTKGRLSCQVYIRSNDLFLGLPFNIASYALLTHMMAHVTGTTPGDLIVTIGDAHIYSNHTTQVKEQLSRSTFKLPALALNPEVTDIDSFTMDDIALVGYESHPAISAPMAV